MIKQIKLYAPASEPGMDGGGSDGGTGLSDTGGAGDVEDAADDGSEVGLDTDPGTSDELGTGSAFGSDGLSPSGDPRMDNIDWTSGTGTSGDDEAGS